MVAATEILRETAALTPELHQKLTAWRRHLHAHPELSLQEKETAAFVQDKLTELGIPFEAGIGGHGIVATLTRGRTRAAASACALTWMHCRSPKIPGLPTPPGHQA
ncbi:metal-dependent amidase/aminoacylase/carboxypeptidase family protein [Bradyrhizobium ottawaense]